VPKLEPEVQRAKNRKEGHIWTFLPGPGSKLVLSDKPKGEWWCEACGLKVEPPRAVHGHEDETCLMRKSR